MGCRFAVEMHSSVTASITYFNFNKCIFGLDVLVLKVTVWFIAHRTLIANDFTVLFYQKES